MQPAICREISNAFQLDLELRLAQQQLAMPSQELLALGEITRASPKAESVG
jgi:hypothetical protein